LPQSESVAATVTATPLVDLQTQIKQSRVHDSGTARSADRICVESRIVAAARPRSTPLRFVVLPYQLR
jgi:hypothetical protein